MRGIVLRGLATSLTVALVAACGGGTTAPSPTFSPVGTWNCLRTTNPSPDSVEIKADGSITITQPGGASASGTWTVSGTTFTVHGLGPGGQEDFTITGDQIVSGSGDNVCTRV